MKWFLQSWVQYLTRALMLIAIIFASFLKDLGIITEEVYMSVGMFGLLYSVFSLILEYRLEPSRKKLVFLTIYITFFSSLVILLIVLYILK
jgi:hypothetical protein